MAFSYLAPSTAGIESKEDRQLTTMPSVLGQAAVYDTMGSRRCVTGTPRHSEDVPTRPVSVGTRFEFDTSAMMAPLFFLSSCVSSTPSRWRDLNGFSPTFSQVSRGTHVRLFQAQFISAQDYAAMGRCRTCRGCAALSGQSLGASRPSTRRSAISSHRRHQPLLRDELETDVSVVAQPSSDLSLKEPLSAVLRDNRLR